MSPIPLALLITPLGGLAISVLFIVFLIGFLRVHSFFALISAAMLVGLLNALNQTGEQRFTKAIEMVMTEFGATTSKIGFTIAAAAVIGMCLMESGAAEKIIRRFIALIGEVHAGLALLTCSFTLCAPVFYDTVIMLLLPLARTLSLRTKKHYLLYVLVICAGGAISNGLIPPAPGPLFVSESLKIDLGVAILGGIAFGILPALGAYAVALWMNRRMVVPVRELPGSRLESLSALAARPESELPGLLASVSPVVVPVALIASGSFLSLFRAQVSPEVAQFITFLGNKNIALFIAGILALALLAHQKRTGWRDVGKVLGPPLETAGVIILIVSAGGAYGAMIKNSGVGDAIRTFAGGNTTHYVLLAWVISASIRVVQGSATVATITAVGIMQSVAGSEGYGVHPIYIMVAIGFGSKFLNWMNDSGFWVVNRFSGLTQGELLRSWSILISVVSLLGLCEVLLVARFFPNFQF